MIASEVITSQDFSFVQSLIYEKAGIVVGDHKREMIQRRLARRVRELHLGTINDYCDILRAAPEKEMVNFVNAITTNLTAFFRENHHFDYLSDQFFPRFLESGEKKLRIWSSACSTGEEPYSISMTMEKALGSQLMQMDAKILATDLDTQVIQTARNGLYSENRVKDLEHSVKSKWFDRPNNNDEASYVIKDQLKQHITFNKLNLLGSWPMKGVFDVVFCRNVLIYFDKPTQEALVNRFLGVIKPGGLLMLGHSESILKGNKDFVSLGKTIYQKVDV